MTVPGEGDPRAPFDPEAAVVAATTEVQQVRERTDEILEGDGAALGAEQDLGPTPEEAWAPAFHAAPAVGKAVAVAFAARQRTVQAEGTETDVDGITMKTPAAVRRDEVAPSTVVVPIRRAPKYRRLLSPVVEDTDAAVFGWTVAEQERSAKQPNAETTAPTGASGNSSIEIDDVMEERAAAADIESGDEAKDPNAIVDRVVLLAGAKNPLRLLTATRGQLDRGDHRMVRIAKVAKDTSEDDMKVIEEYAERNDFANVNGYRAITAERIANGELDVEDPVALGELTCAGLKRLLGDVRSGNQPRAEARPAAAETDEDA